MVNRKKSVKENKLKTAVLKLLPFFGALVTTPEFLRNPCPVKSTLGADMKQNFLQPKLISKDIQYLASL
jgi:hypothetical protein